MFTVIGAVVAVAVIGSALSCVGGTLVFGAVLLGVGAAASR